MEPFYQIRVPNAGVPDINSELESIGLTVTQRDDSWLGSKHSHLCDVICECDGVRTVFAIGPDLDDGASSIIVYLNRAGDSLAPVVRAHFDAMGASWDYFG